MTRHLDSFTRFAYRCCMGLLVAPLFGALMGLIAGSFLATLVIRWPQKQSVMSGRSHCDSCNQKLGIFDLIPILSYALNSGRCRYCGEAINPKHMMIELACFIIGGVVFAIAPTHVALFGALFGWMLVALIALDIEHFWLPDRLVIPLMLIGLLATPFVPTPSFLDRMIGGFAAFIGLYLIGALYFQIRKKEGLGGGDPKLFAAIGCWLGWQILPLVLLGACLIGLLSIVVARMAQRDVSMATQLPFGAYMAMAAFPLWVLQNSGINLIFSN